MPAKERGNARFDCDEDDGADPPFVGRAIERVAKVFGFVPRDAENE